MMGPEVFYELIHRDGSISCCFFLHLFFHFLFSAASKEEEEGNVRDARARERSSCCIRSGATQRK